MKNFNIKEPRYTVMCIRKGTSVDYMSAFNLTSDEVAEHIKEYPLGLLGYANASGHYAKMKEMDFIRFDLIEEPFILSTIDARGNEISVGSKVYTSKFVEKEIEYIFFQPHSTIGGVRIKLKGMKRITENSKVLLVS